jgi:Secretion system C-terminal sorting domain
MYKFLIATGFFFWAFSGYSAIIYVNTNAAGANNGTSWTNAYSDLQDALSIAFVNDEIWVAAGTYKPTQSNDRLLSFVMKNGVDMYGGFQGTETTIVERNIAANPTYLSGDIGATGDNTDNTRKVVKMQNMTTPFIFDGFRVVSGYDESGSGKGAGMYVFNNPGTDISIKNTILYNNYAYHSGGGMIIDNSNTTFNNCEFLYNSSFNYGGGAIYSANVSNSNIYLYDCKFIGNNSRQRPVINFDGDELVMERNTISSNTSSSSGNIINVSHGVLKFEINNSLIVGNLVEDGGSSVISSYTSDLNSSSLTNVTICHNRNSSSFDVYAEAIYQSNSAMIISNCIIYGNTPSDVNAQIDGGNTVQNSYVENGYTTGIQVSSADPLFVNPGTLSSAPFDASAFDYSLQEGSPAINDGNNIYAQNFSFDLQNNIRIQQQDVDCGAIESSYPDFQAPIALCTNVTLPLSATGQAILNQIQVNNNSTDNIGIATYELSQTTFDCSNIGQNTVQLTLADDAGNMSTCSATITVMDALDPSIQTQNITVFLDESGGVSIAVEAINNGTSDNCGLDTMYLSQYNFTCADAGTNQIVFTAADFFGNTVSANVTVTVVDQAFPLAQALNLDLYLNMDGEAWINASDANNGSTDDCGIETMTLNQYSFACEDIGANQIIFTVSDQFGNLSSTPIVVTVHDTIVPITQGQSITVNLFDSNPAVIPALQINSNSSDNCSFSQTVTPSSFSEVGVYQVALTTTDQSGNSSSETYTVTVVNEPVVDINEIAPIGLQIYPNPTEGLLHISNVALGTSVEIRLFDVTGKLLSSQNYSSTQDIMYHLTEPNGVYLLEIVTSSYRSNRIKMVKI